MKKIFIPLLTSLILLQSCYTYKTVDHQALEVNQKYKIIVNNKKLKVKLNQAKDSTIVVTHKGNQQTIAKTEIQEFKKRKFSVLKTIALPVSVVVGIVALFVISDPKIGEGTTINSPN